VDSRSRVHTSFRYRGVRVAITKDGLGWHVQTSRTVVTRHLLVEALEVALPRLSRPERDRLTAVLLTRAAKPASRLNSLTA
jgi:hypothetical protein